MFLLYHTYFLFSSSFSALMTSEQNLASIQTRTSPPKLRQCGGPRVLPINLDRHRHLLRPGREGQRDVAGPDRGDAELRRGREHAAYVRWACMTILFGIRAAPPRLRCLRAFKRIFSSKILLRYSTLGFFWFRLYS